MRTIIILFFGLLLSNCSNTRSDSSVSLDHVSIWVDDPKMAKDKLVELGFKAIPDSLSLVHQGQGTSGRFFYFLNTYLEFIFINDSTEFHHNIKKNDGLDFLERSSHISSGYSPFGLGLQMDKYNKDKIPFEVIEYRQDWMENGNSIYAAKNSKLNKDEPSTFVIYPEIQYDQFENMDSLVKIPEAYSIWRSFYKHGNGVEKVSKIRIHLDLNSNPKSKSLEAISDIENIELIQSKENMIDLYFDENKQKKSFDLRPELPLVLHW